MENEITTVSSDNSAGRIHIPVEDMSDTTCPKCGSGDITGGFVETGDGIASQELSCNVCDERWKNVYDFSAVYLIDEGEDGLVIEIPREDAKKADLEAKANTAKGQEDGVTKETQWEGLQPDGDCDMICPSCCSEDIVGESIEIEDGGALQHCTCSRCKAGWTNAYDFAGSFLDLGDAGDPPQEKLQELRTANENLRFELEVAYGENADLERRIDEMQKS